LFSILLLLKEKDGPTDSESLIKMISLNVGTCEMQTGGDGELILNHGGDFQASVGGGPTCAPGDMGTARLEIGHPLYPGIQVGQSIDSFGWKILLIAR
jgi:hypothetical protein